jgi:hypothetical protein
MTDEPIGDGLDPLIHEIARLRICAALAATTAGYITQDRGKPRGPGRPRTWVTLTDLGRTAYTGHLAALQLLTQPG